METKITERNLEEKINREIRSSLFIDYFGKDEIVGKENFLNLYNAIHDSHLTLEDTDLQLTEIDNTAYKTFQNDLGMLVNGRLVVLMEHQSTVNPNMPFRMLEYVTKIYSGLVETRKRYSTKLQKIPTPEFYVFYNGKNEMPAESVLKLSDMFTDQEPLANLELTVKVFNINKRDLFINHKSDKLRMYSKFLEHLFREANLSNPKECESALLSAMKMDLLPGYMERKLKEIRNMLIAEYDYNEDIAVKKEEAFEDGFASGKSEGIEQTKINAAKLMVTKFNIPIPSVAQELQLTEMQIAELEKAIKLIP